MAAKRNFVSRRTKPAAAPKPKEEPKPFAMDVDMTGFKRPGGGIPKGLGSRAKKNNEARKENNPPTGDVATRRVSDKRSRISGGALKAQRGEDLVPVGKMFDGTASSMEDYRAREAARRKNRVALQSRTNDPKLTAPAPKKMGRRELRKATSITPTRAAGGNTIARPKDQQDMADRRAAYFERMMGN